MTRRRGFLLGSAAAVFAPRIALGRGREDLVERARRLSRAPYTSPARPVPPPFDMAGYQSYRAIRPRPGGAGGIALGGGVQADLLPPGPLFDVPVEIVLPGRDAPVAFRRDLFSYDPSLFPQAPGYFPGGLDPASGGAGFSGFRVTAPLNRPDKRDEVLVVQGASYFRALAEGLVYGLSARALGIGTGGNGPEEFPAITRVELSRVEGGSLRFGALVRSPSATAAFFCTLTPGEVTETECELVLFPRETIAEAGIAPLTSMFYFDAMGPAFADDFRPAVHDSNILWMRNGAGEELWRPLANPATAQMSAFAGSGPEGFALLQTPRDFEGFEDAEAAYHRRPSACVYPKGDWGAGAVHLFEIPTESEHHDNIVAFWRPGAALQAGREYRFAYSLRWSGAGPAHDLPLTPVRSASGLQPGGAARRYVIDYAAEGSVPDAVALRVTAQGAEGEVAGEAVFPLPEPGRLRATFVFTPAAGDAVAEFRMTLHDAATGAGLAPVWLYRWTPARGGGA